jgi:hypothetical protein
MKELGMRIAVFMVSYLIFSKTLRAVIMFQKRVFDLTGLKSKVESLVRYLRSQNHSPKIINGCEN